MNPPAPQTKTLLLDIDLLLSPSRQKRREAYRYVNAIILTRFGRAK
jgi:hypothetical protein